MKRMVKNGDLIDVEPDGSITVAGKPVGGGGGGDYTAGSNIEISEAKEIAVTPNLQGVNSLALKDSRGYDNLIYTESGGVIKIRSASALTNYPKFRLVNYDYLNKRELTISFDCDPNYAETILIRGQKINGTSYAFLTKGASVPFVPSDNGTYVLKATVTNGAVTYSWVAQ